ncbi:MAG: GntR family transcriptional regulator [Usitatibacteraceae bacterium]
MATQPSAGLTALAYAQLRDEIVDGKLLPGEPLYEIHLATRLGMSRTPIREALKLLAQDGYVELLPSRGYTVPKRSHDDLREFFELRAILEAGASRHAALRATDAEIAQLEKLCQRYETEKNDEKWTQLGHDFHSLIIEAARTSRLKNMLHSLNAQIVISRRTVARADAVRRATAIRDHRAILDAIKTRNDVLAESLAAAHVLRSYETTLRSYSPDLFASKKSA